MPFNRPTKAELIATAKAELASRLDIDAILPRSLLDVHARVIAGAAHGLHGHLGYLARQLFPDSADAENLERWASIWGVQRKTAVGATGDATFTGSDTATIPLGTKLLRADGVEYETTESGAISGTTATLPVQATLEGSLSNADPGVTLNLSSPLAGIDSAATAAAGLSGGADQETDEALRDRVLRRIQDPPQGGSAADYESWALEVPAVTRAFALELYLGLGTVGVTFTTDNEASSIPSSEKVAEVAAYIEERRPATAAVTVFAPVAVNLDPDITLTPNTPEVQAAVRQNLIDMLLVEARPGGTLTVDKITEAISTTPGEQTHVLNSPVLSVTVQPGELLFLGTITWS